MNNKARFIAFYLPQFHPIPENDEWWGKGFTEWHSVVRAKPLFIGHKQPHLPADLGFYDLRLEETRIAQAKLAKEAGIEGFCYWHYWFGNGKRLLERPFNEVLSSGKPNFPFCLGWANHSWEKKLWDKNGNSELLIEQTYPGKDDYINHFYTVLPAFKDKRYITIDNKPLFVIYNPGGFPEISKFLLIWRSLAIENGLNDIFFVAKDADSRKKDEYISMGFDAIYNLDHINIHHHLNLTKKIWLYIKREWLHIPTTFEYKDAINHMITSESTKIDVFPSIAPNWDHTPRSGRKSIILKNSTPKYFKKAVLLALNAVKNKPAEKRIVFLVSWNEWGEGNYLEPDTEFGNGYLNALKEAIEFYESEK